MSRAGVDRAQVLQRCYAAAVRAVQPAAALRAPLLATPRSELPCWIIGVGKAAPGMSRTIVEWLRENDREPAGGIVVAANRGDAVHEAIQTVVGEHPIPGAQSAQAAAAIDTVLHRVPAHADVHIAISGGASSLMAGPLPGLTQDDVTRTFELLLTSGLDIHEMNAVRKRITRWSAGRMALRVAGRRVHVWIISDVIGDDLATIASGPCTADPWTGDQVQAMLAARGLLERLPGPVQHALHRETPKPGDPLLQSIQARIVATNRTAIAAAVSMGHELGIRAQEIRDPMQGDAARMGREIAGVMGDVTGPAQLFVWGGETTVAITGTAGIGGRSQELALAAAQSLYDHGTEGALLAAGTDGRDGPTDAAGGIVDRYTWERIARAGRDPDADLAFHDAYPALDAAGALIRTGPSGTNVMDLAIAVTGWR